MTMLVTLVVLMMRGEIVQLLLQGDEKNLTICLALALNTCVEKITTKK